jgi:hypothetical protein
MAAVHKSTARSKSRKAPPPVRAKKPRMLKQSPASQGITEEAADLQAQRAAHDPDHLGVETTFTDTTGFPDSTIEEQHPEVEMHGDTPIHPESHQPGTPGFVERRRAGSPQRRATDQQPVVDTGRLARAVEAIVAASLGKMLHRVVPSAIREAVGTTLDSVPATTVVPPLDGAAPITTTLKNKGEAVEAVVRNGVRCPDYGTVTGSLWLLFAKAGAGTTLSQAKQLAKDNGYSETSAAIALYNWRKFHGVPSPRGQG